MKITRRNDPTWMQEGKCPFYFFEKDSSLPNCFITSSIVKGDANIFESTDEAMKFMDHDCGGFFETCPFIPELWDFSSGGKTEDLSASIIVNDSDPFIQISFGWPFPQTEETSCDALMIPTNTYLRFNDMLPVQSWKFDDEITLDLMAECATLEKPVEVGEVFATEAGGSGYGKIVHCVISGLGGQPVDDVSDIVMEGLGVCQKMNAASVVIHPLCLMMGNTDGIAQTLFTEILGINKFFKKSHGSGISYIDIMMPPTQEAYGISMEVAGVILS